MSNQQDTNRRDFLKASAAVAGAAAFAGGVHAAGSDEIKVGHVVRVLDGPLAPIPCASRTQYQRCEDCNEATCQVRHLMLEVRQAIAEVLDQRTLAEMRDIVLDDLTVARDINGLPLTQKVLA